MAIFWRIKILFNAISKEWKNIKMVENPKTNALLANVISLIITVIIYILCLLIGIIIGYFIFGALGLVK
jgi:ABC-type glycerol-3-phosphate transport system permease component